MHPYHPMSLNTATTKCGSSISAAGLPGHCQCTDAPAEHLRQSNLKKCFMTYWLQTCNCYNNDNCMYCIPWHNRPEWPLQLLCVISLLVKSHASDCSNPVQFTSTSRRWTGVFSKRETYATACVAGIIIVEEGR